MPPLGGRLALLVWGYAIAWLLVNDRVKLTAPGGSSTPAALVSFGGRGAGAGGPWPEREADRAGGSPREGGAPIAGMAAHTPRPAGPSRPPDASARFGPRVYGVTVSDPTIDGWIVQ